METPIADRCICVLKALTVVEPPLVLNAFNVTVVPDNAAVNVNWSVPFDDTIGP